MVAEILDEIGRRVAAFFAPYRDGIYLAEWWAMLLALIAICMLIGYFAQFKWVRAVLGILILIASAFVAGGMEMYRHIKGHGNRPRAH